MLDIAGLELTAEDRELLLHPHAGGLILFARNFASREQVTELNRAIREIRPDLIIAVDQEGGRVQRFREGFVRLPAMRKLGRLYDNDNDAALSLAHDCGWLMAAEVLATGVDISFAPVLDIDAGISRVIDDRAFHSKPAHLITLARAFIAGMHEAGMAATGKHFPGHGSVAADSHVDLPVDERDLDSLRALDLQPFAALCPELEGIMPAHVLYPAVDAQPAGFSPFWLQQILRSEFGFNGVIFSDDLSMEGATMAGSFSDRTHAALDAGCDMVLVCNNRPAALDVLNALATRNTFTDPARMARLRGRINQPVDESRRAAIVERLTTLDKTLDNL